MIKILPKNRGPYVARLYNEKGVIADLFTIEHANLFATAPELLASLKSVVGYAEQLKKGQIWDINYFEIGQAIQECKKVINAAEKGV